MRDAERQALDTQTVVLARAERNATIALWTETLLTLVICALVALAIARLIVRPLTQLADAMRRLARRDLEVSIPGMRQHNEVGAMARAVAVFKKGLIELDRTSLLRATADTLPAMVGYIDTDRRVGFLNAEFAAWFDLRVGDVSEVHGRLLNEAFPVRPFLVRRCSWKPLSRETKHASSIGSPGKGRDVATSRRSTGLTCRRAGKCSAW